MKNANYELYIPAPALKFAAGWYKDSDISGLSLHTIKLLNDRKIVGECIDIACGSGFFILNLCDYNFSRHMGIDIHKPFVENATKSALENEKNCTFLNVDANEFISKTQSKWDIVISLAATDILGDLQTTFSKIRSLTKDSGHYVIGWTEIQIDCQIEINRIKQFLFSNFNDDIIEIFTKENIYDFETSFEKLSKKMKQLSITEDTEKQIIESWLLRQNEILKKVDNQIFQSVIFLIKKNP